MILRRERQPLTWGVVALLSGFDVAVASRESTVCVTGASGYVASALINQLLSATSPEGVPYKVVGTVRDASKWQAERFFKDVQLFEADLLDASSFDAPFALCGALMHTASPFWLNFNPETIATTVQGTENVLRAAKKAGIRRVVVTGSCASVTPQDPDVVLPVAGAGEPFTELDWNRDSTEQKGPYRLSKRLQEEKVWEFAAGEGLGGHYAVVNPSFIIGPPALQRAEGESVLFMKRMLEGAYAKEGTPPAVMGVVDVRDVALAHIRALERDEANGKRFILSSSRAYTWLELADFVRVHRNYGTNFALPTAVKGSIPKTRVRYSSKRAEEVLGVTLTPPATSARDMADQLLFTRMVNLDVAERRRNDPNAEL